MRSLFSRLLAAQLATVMVALLAVGFALSYLYTQYIFDLKERDLMQIGEQLADELSGGFMGPSRADRIKTIITAARIYGDTGIMVVSPEGLVLLASSQDRQDIRLSPDEVRSIFSGNTIRQRTFVSKTSDPAFAVAVPITTPIGVAGAVVLQAPMRDIMHTVYGGRQLIFWAGVLAAGLAIGVSYVSARRIAGPLQQMREVAIDMAGGNFAHRVEVPGHDEVAELASALNNMASKLDTTIRDLAAEKSKTESVITGLAEGVIAVNTQGRLLLANSAARNLFGPHMLEVGQPLPTQTEATPFELLSAAFRKALDSGEPQKLNMELPGSTLLVSVSGVETPSGEPLGAVALIQDVSERHRLEKMRRDFVADVSHELRTPLTSIYGFAQAMLDGVVNKEDQVRRYLKVITDESLRLVRLTNALLDLSRIESQHITLQRTPLELSEVVSDALASLEPQLAEKQVTAHISIEPGLPRVFADADRLEQILLNLLDNATRHVPESGHVTVSASVVPECPAYVSVSVIDNGPGIPESEMPFIWERFYKVDKARKQNRKQGTGLGLVIVKQLVELHGGTVRAYNVPSGGACFTLTLPIANNTPADEAAGVLGTAEDMPPAPA